MYCLHKCNIMFKHLNVVPELIHYIPGYIVLAVLIVHWISCLIYVCHANTHFYGGLVYKEWFFKLIASITLVLTFMNIV